MGSFGLFGGSGHFSQKLLGRPIGPSGGFAEFDERRQAVWKTPFLSLIDKASERAKVPPISARQIAAESSRKLPRGQRTHLLAQDTSMVEPELKVVG